MNRENDFRIVYSEYNQEANQIFFELFNDFRNKVDALDRDGDENVFQLLRSKYLKTLRQQLGGCANLLIDKCDVAEVQGRLRINFSEKITYLQKEFTRKSEML